MQGIIVWPGCTYVGGAAGGIPFMSVFGGGAENPPAPAERILE